MARYWLASLTTQKWHLSRVGNRFFALAIHFPIPRTKYFIPWRPLARKFSETARYRPGSRTVSKCGFSRVGIRSFALMIHLFTPHTKHSSPGSPLRAIPPRQLYVGRRRPMFQNANFPASISSFSSSESAFLPLARNTLLHPDMRRTPITAGLRR